MTVIAVAPMMDCTDRHARFFMRLISPSIRLYTEMITAQALIYGDAKKLLAYHPHEKYLALQLGGSNPAQLATCAQLGESLGYDEINLNVGCPSSRVAAGRFGACLMREPQLVAACVAAMTKAVEIPITIKCRIGIDDQDSLESLIQFVETLAQAGCQHFIIHARKAWLSGLSPKENREIPPLRHDRVYQIKTYFPGIMITINGGFNSIDQIKYALSKVDGVMVGRAAYRHPYFLAEIEQAFFKEPVRNRFEIIDALLPYLENELARGTRLASITRHLFGLFYRQPHGGLWRRFLSENMHKTPYNVAILHSALQVMYQQAS